MAHFTDCRSLSYRKSDLGGGLDVESGGASVPLVWHIGEVHDDARLRAACGTRRPRFGAGVARVFVELLRLEPHITHFGPFLQL